MIGYLNINSLRNKHVSIEELVKGNIDVFLLFKTRLDETFPYKQFEIQGYKIFQKDRKKHGGWSNVFSKGSHIYDVHKILPILWHPSHFIRKNEQ